MATAGTSRITSYQDVDKLAGQFHAMSLQPKKQPLYASDQNAADLTKMSPEKLQAFVTETLRKKDAALQDLADAKLIQASGRQMQVEAKQERVEAKKEAHAGRQIQVDAKKQISEADGKFVTLLQGMLGKLGQLRAQITSSKNPNSAEQLQKLAALEGEITVLKTDLPPTAQEKQEKLNQLKTKAAALLQMVR